ncbi:MAG: DUF1538 domain-containing protein [Zetaproteobacteria bacterium]|nr:MAG: DUF1538 domain-containing protein [Zetaproteobacteria bacterium]
MTSVMFHRVLLETLRDVAPILLLLVGFQLFVLRRPIIHRWRVIRGFLYVLIGLTLFLLGLEQAIFPLGALMAEQLTADIDPATAGAWGRMGRVYLFAFAIGLATTLAEPALVAVSMRAERVSGGTISAFGLRLAVASGVAVGVAIGCFRIVSGTPLWIYMLSAYALVMLLTVRTPHAIIPLAYDLGGVTTSTVTVPLLAALGIGLAESIPGRSPLIDGFGLVAFASIFPIITVLLYAIVGRRMR